MQIAQLVGTTRPTVNAHLQAAAESGLVSISRSSVVLLDRLGIADALNGRGKHRWRRDPGWWWCHHRWHPASVAATTDAGTDGPYGRGVSSSGPAGQVNPEVG